MNNFKNANELDKKALELIEFIINSHTKNILDALESMTRERNELKAERNLLEAELESLKRCAK